MPLYDCMLLAKPHLTKDRLTDLVVRVAKHVYTRNGLLTDFKSMGTVQLGYGLRKREGRYYEGQLMQINMMVPPGFHQELHYLNKEERLLRWLLVKHRDVKMGMESDIDHFGRRHKINFENIVDVNDAYVDSEEDDYESGEEEKQ